MEIRMINPRKEPITPTSFPCLNPAKLRDLESVFKSGDPSTLDPAELVCLPDGSLVVFDGNHRLALAFEHNKEVQAAIITPGDTYNSGGSGSVISYERCVLIAKAYKRVMGQRGINGFGDYFA